MPALRWNCELAVGEPTLDASHRKMFARLRRLSTVPPEDFARVYDQTVAALERAFHTEETLMEQLDYPGLASHREQHARVLSGLHHAAAALAEGHAGPARYAVVLLGDWLCLHITTMDRALALVLRMASQPPSPSLDMQEATLPAIMATQVWSDESGQAAYGPQLPPEQASTPARS